MLQDMCYTLYAFFLLEINKRDASFGGMQELGTSFLLEIYKRNAYQLLCTGALGILIQGHI